MDWLTGILLPIALFLVAVVIGHHELTRYHEARDGSDLFVYSKGRFVRRMCGVGLLVVIGGTLVVVELFPARTSATAALYLAALVTEVVVLLALPLIDLWETGRSRRTAKAELTRQEGPGRGRRSRRDRLR